MRTLLVPILVSALVLALGGCGNWSNEDLVFLAALPDRAQLESKLPGTATAEQALTQDQSEAYRHTRDASREFNGALFDLLDLMERVRTLPPTTREPDRRVWGPWGDPSDRRYFIRVVIERSESDPDPATGATRPLYRYAAEESEGRDGPWTQVVHGEYEVTGSIRDGIGAVVFDADALRALGRADPTLRQLARIEVSYRTSPWPMRVEMHLFGTPAASFADLAYAYVEDEDGAGAMSFAGASDVAPGPGIEDLSVLAAWRPDGTGRAVVTVSGGDVPAPGGTWEECWDGAGVLTWREKSWSAPEGDASLCPAWDALPPAP